jgi:DNA-binding IclR family transcriptional regulator
VSVLVKAAQVIDVLNRTRVPTKLGVIADEVGLPKSSAHRLLNDLASLGVVRKLEDGNYTPGYRLIQWGQAAELALGIRQAAEPIMRRLSEEVAESVHLHVPEGSHRVCAAGVPGPQTLRPVIRLGQVLPLGAGASGRLLLAYADDRVRTEARQQADDRVEASWPEESELAMLRERGWATSTGELESGLTAVSAVVMTRTGHALGALTVAGASARLPEERCAQIRPLVVSAARELARTIGA